MFRPYPLGVSRQRVGPEFMGRLVAGAFPFEVLGSGRLTVGVGPGPKVPTAAWKNKVKLFQDLLETVRLRFQVRQPAILSYMGSLSHMRNLLQINT